MLNDNDIIKMIFGFKVKFLRQQQQLSYQQLADLTGLSTSYLHDIEKGKKYPKVDKITGLAQALEVSYDYLVSTKASKKLQPIIDLLTSDFLKEFPLEFFGISPEMVFELFSNTPDKVNAFVGTIFKITRNYQVQREGLFLAALRSYQDMFDNYFPELEARVEEFRQTFSVGLGPYAPAFLEKILAREFRINVDRTTLPGKEALRSKRSVYLPDQRRLLLNQSLSTAQENFLLGRELAFQFLQLTPRPFLTRISEVDSFEKLLHNFQASYFAVALLMDETRLIADIQQLAASPQWEPQAWLELLDRYDVTPEMLLQRLTNVLPHHFGLRDLFFIRIQGDKDLKNYRMTKELHLAQPQSPYANQLNEHYCRRWVSVNIIKNLRANQHVKGQPKWLIDAQISQYWESPNHYFCLSIAKPDSSQETISSVTIGLLINDDLRKHLHFLDDPQVNTRTVNTTCERCSIPDCEARVVPPIIVERKRQLIQEQAALAALAQTGLAEMGNNADTES